jgi:hypothetical protein
MDAPALEAVRRHREHGIQVCAELLASSKPIILAAPEAARNAE